MTRPRNLLWLLTLWLCGCVTSPAPGRCYLLDYYPDGSQVWECFNGKHEPVCHSEAECRALSDTDTPSEDTTP